MNNSLSEKEKVCSNKNCTNKNPQSINNFYKNPTGKNGLRSICKQCDILRTAKWAKNNSKKCTGYKKTWRDKNPEKVKNAHLLLKYGIDIKIYSRMLRKQNNKCAICERHASEFKYGLGVDHDHETGKIRGLLCVSVIFYWEMLKMMLKH